MTSNPTSWLIKTPHASAAFSEFTTTPPVNSVTQDQEYDLPPRDQSSPNVSLRFSSQALRVACAAVVCRANAAGCLVKLMVLFTYI